mgnify:CR=1 FL=1
MRSVRVMSPSLVHRAFGSATWRAMTRLELRALWCLAAVIAARYGLEGHPLRDLDSWIRRVDFGAHPPLCNDTAVGPQADGLLWHGQGLTSVPSAEWSQRSVNFLFLCLSSRCRGPVHHGALLHFHVFLHFGRKVRESFLCYVQAGTLQSEIYTARPVGAAITFVLQAWTPDHRGHHDVTADL